AGMADGGSGHADTSNSCPTRTAAVGHLCHHPVRLMNRRASPCFRRCRDGQGKASNSNPPDHSSPPFGVRLSFEVDLQLVHEAHRVLARWALMHGVELLLFRGFATAAPLGTSLLATRAPSGQCAALYVAPYDQCAVLDAA